MGILIMILGQAKRQSRAHGLGFFAEQSGIAERMVHGDYLGRVYSRERRGD